MYLGVRINLKAYSHCFFTYIFITPRRTVYCAVRAESVYFRLIDICKGFVRCLYQSESIQPLFPYIHFYNPRRTVYCAVRAESVYFRLIDLFKGSGFVTYEMSVKESSTGRSNILG